VTSSSSPSTHLNFATRIAAEISLSLLTMTNKAFRSQDISRFAPCRIHLKMCVKMKEEAQAHYFGNILANRIPV